MRRERIRPQVEGKPELLDSLIVAARIEEHFAKFMVNVKREWIQVTSSSRLGNRLIELTADSKIIGQTIVRLGVACIQFNRALEFSCGIGVIAVIQTELPSQCRASIATATVQLHRLACVCSALRVAFGWG